MVALVLYDLYFVNVNHTSVHSFYRDRLSRAYLLRTDEAGHIHFNDEQKLSTLNGSQNVAPYHLINVTLNFQASKDPDLRGRKADFFIFSKRFTGSERTGYCETTRMQAMDEHLNLGTAMAISGAAATPNMGTLTVAPLVFIMTMLNVRLGYWLPNPGRARRGLFPFAAGPGYLWREALGWVKETDSYVNVSDGGHIENLGVYELLRRRCKRIIVVDGEEDPELRFGSLVQLLRYARIDMGIEIEIDLDPIRKGEDGGSQSHWALGTIRYGQDQSGQLVYIKSAITGDESDDIRDYQSKNPTFPHETTADQFFDEAQFEAYRAWGSTAPTLSSKRK